MTEKAFYKALLAEELGSERLIKDVKTCAERKKPVAAWVRTAAAVFCVVLVGSIGVMLARSPLLDNLDKKYESAADSKAVRTAEVQDYGTDICAEIPEVYMDACTDESLLHEKQLAALSKYAKIIVTATPSGENEVTVTKAFRGAQAGQVLKTAYCGLPAGQEYLLFLLKIFEGMYRF